MGARRLVAGGKPMQADEYERKYMGADDAIAVSRARLGFVWSSFFVIGVLVSAFAIYLSCLVPGMHRLTWLAAFSGIFLAANWLTSMVVRVIVTPEEVRIQHGLFGPSIALADIVSVHAERHGFKRFLLGIGWGLGGKSLDGSHLYSTLGVARGLVIRYRTAKGIAEAFVSSDDPEALLAAIEGASTRARVALDAAQDEQVEQPSAALLDADASWDPQELDADIPRRRGA